MGIIREEDMISGRNLTDVLREKRQQAAAILDRTGSLPDFWELGIRVRELGATQRFNGPQEYFEHGLGYFRHVQDARFGGDENKNPTLSGLILWMGFSSRSAFEWHVRRNPDFRDAHSTLMTMLSLHLEEALALTGVNTAGITFRLKNLPEGFLPTDDVNTPSRYNWKDRKQTELTGQDGSPLFVHENNLDPSETYMAMLQAGARLVDAGEAGEADE